MNIKLYNYDNQYLIMLLNKNIFRANDIRGIAYQDLSKEVITNLGKALGSITCLLYTSPSPRD